MHTQSEDTPPEVEKRLIALIKKASISKRLARTRSLSQSVIKLSRRAILRANPDFNQRDVNLAFLKYHYGDELSDSVREYLDKRKI
ncbi:MAG: hypothetical protein HQ517_17775 [SAR324 cluster bacterium]|nr:hypothetical protein [SAR324 cluster bacterium]